VIAKLLVILVVIAPDGRLLEGVVHSLDLDIGCHSACKIFERRLTTEAYVTSRPKARRSGCCSHT
jgi:hypothetical protein